MESVSNHLVASLPFPVMVLDQIKIYDKMHGKIFDSGISKEASDEIPWQEIQG